MKKLTNMIVAGIMAFYGLLALPVLMPTDVAVAANKDQVCEGIKAVGGGNACDGAAGNSLGSFLKKIIDILLFIIGAISVLMIIIGGLRYVLSAGDSAQTKAAKDTILYSVVGLIVAFMAYAIVGFVTSSL